MFEILKIFLGFDFSLVLISKRESAATFWPLPCGPINLLHFKFYIQAKKLPSKAAQTLCRVQYRRLFAAKAPAEPPHLLLKPTLPPKPSPTIGTAPLPKPTTNAKTTSSPPKLLRLPKLPHLKNRYKKDTTFVIIKQGDKFEPHFSCRG